MCTAWRPMGWQPRHRGRARAGHADALQHAAVACGGGVGRAPLRGLSFAARCARADAFRSFRQRQCAGGRIAGARWRAAHRAVSATASTSCTRPMRRSIISDLRMGQEPNYVFAFAVAERGSPLHPLPSRGVGGRTGRCRQGAGLAVAAHVGRSAAAAALRCHGVTQVTQGIASADIAADSWQHETMLHGSAVPSGSAFQPRLR